jgi:hypothetical protein
MGHSMPSAIFVTVLAAASGHTLAIEHLELDAPAGYVLETKTGPDFAVYYVYRSDRPGSQLGVYVGNHPTRFAEGKAVRTEPVRIGRRKAHWVFCEEGTAKRRELNAELLVNRPFGSEPPQSEYLHMFITAGTMEALAELKAIATTIRPKRADQ